MVDSGLCDSVTVMCYVASFPPPVSAELSGPIQSGPGVADSPDRAAEDPSLHLQLSEPVSPRSVPKRRH